MAFNAAVLVEAAAPLRIESLNLTGLADTDVVVRVCATSLCHTDLEAVRGDLRTPLPFVPGHEAAGIVEWIGKHVRGLSVGDPVITSWNPHCNECFYCARQQTILCQPYRDHAAQAYHFDGRPRLLWQDRPVHQLMYSGSFAELCVVSEACAIRVSREMPLNRACLIGCGVMTGVGAVVNVAEVEQGATVTVIGCGAVGLSVVQGARMAGAERIIAVDRQQDRLDMATALGATHTLAVGDSLIELHAAYTHGRGADYVFEAAGNPAAFAPASISYVREGRLSGSENSPQTRRCLSVGAR